MRIFSIYLFFSLLASPLMADFDIGALLLDETEEVLYERLPYESEAVPLGLSKKMDEDFKKITRPNWMSARLMNELDKEIFMLPALSNKQNHLFAPDARLRFSPPQPSRFASWTVKVIGFEGNIIDQWKGEGPLPAEVEWNGFKNGWVRLKPGQPYVIEVEGRTPNGKIIREPSPPIKLDAYQTTTEEKLTLYLSPSILASKTEGTSLSKTGNQWIQSAAQTIGQFAGKPVHIQVYSKDYQSGQELGQSIIETLSRELFIDKDTIMFDIQIEPVDPEEVRISVLGINL